VSSLAEVHLNDDQRKALQEDLKGLHKRGGKLHAAAILVEDGEEPGISEAIRRLARGRRLGLAGASRTSFD